MEEKNALKPQKTLCNTVFVGKTGTSLNVLERDFQLGGLGKNGVIVGELAIKKGNENVSRCASQLTEGNVKEKFRGNLKNVL